MFLLNLPNQICRNLKYVFIKSTQTNLQKCITWPKKSRKGKHEWNKACAKTGFQPKKLNTQIRKKVIFSISLLFQLFRVFVVKNLIG
jgi:hypothetical protein